MTLNYLQDASYCFFAQTALIHYSSSLTFLSIILFRSSYSSPIIAFNSAFAFYSSSLYYYFSSLLHAVVIHLTSFLISSFSSCSFTFHNLFSSHFHSIWTHCSLASSDSYILLLPSVQTTSTFSFSSSLAWYTIWTMLNSVLVKSKLAACLACSGYSYLIIAHFQSSLILIFKILPNWMKKESRVEIVLRGSGIWLM